MKSIGDLIKSKRKELKLSQEYMADKLGVNARTYQGYEYGEVIPRLPKLKIISELLGLSLTDLVGENMMREENASIVEDYRDKYYKKLEEEEGIRKDIESLRINLDLLAAKIIDSDRHLSQLIVTATAELSSLISGLASPSVQKGSGRQSGKK